jgi:hypothetical protein
MQTGFMKSSEGGGIGSGATRRKPICSDWTSLLSKDNGGPGEVPGRAEAVKAALELSEQKRRRRELKKRK